MFVRNQTYFLNQQVSGIQFAFDPTKPPGSRVDPKLVKIGDEYIDMGDSEDKGKSKPPRTYRMATKSYLMKVSFINNRIAGVRLALGAFKARSKGWDWSRGPIQEP